MADVIKRAEAQLEEAAQAPQKSGDAANLKALFAAFEAEIQHQLKAFRATAGERAQPQAQGGANGGARMPPGSPHERHHASGRTDMMLTISEAMARDIRGGGPLARALQQTYAVGRKPTQR